jgi:hypothetical protein
MRSRGFFALCFTLSLLLGACSDSSDSGPSGDPADAGWLPMADTGGPGTQDGNTSDGDAPNVSPDAPAVDTAVVEDGGPVLDVPLLDEDTAPNPVSGDPTIVVDPEQYTFSYISPLAQILTRQISIANAGGSVLQLTDLVFEPADSDFSLVLVPPMPKDLAPGKATMVHVRFEEGNGAPVALQIHSTDPARPIATVSFESHIKATVASPDPCASLSPSQLNFGNVVRGHSAMLQTTLANCSDTSSLSLSDITRSQNFPFGPLSEEFQIDNVPAFPELLAPGASILLDVSYSPKLAGPDGGYFILHTDDPAEPQVHLDVSGVGLEPPPEELGLTIKLSWDEDLCDVDSHLIAPGGDLFSCDTDCFYSNPSPDWGLQGQWQDDPFLDVDDVDGYGPEHINISEPIMGTYTYVVHYFDDTYLDSSGTGTNATVEVLSFGQTIAEFGPVYLDTTNRTWDVFTIQWPTKSVVPLGSTWKISSGQMNACFNWPFP